MHEAVEAAAEALAGPEAEVTGWIIGIMAAVIAVLVGITRNRAQKLRRTTEELEAERTVSKRRKNEAQVLEDMVDEIGKIRSEKRREEVPPPDPGDVDSRLDRLGRMHEH